MKQTKDIIFQLSEKEHQAIEQEKRHYENPRAASVGALKIVQKQRGWITDGAIHAIAKVLEIPASDVEGVATFYSRIFRQPVGRHIIYYCDSVVCHINGYQDVLDELQKILAIKPGETTRDSCFTLLPNCCLGNCDKGPTMMIDSDTHSYINPSEISTILEQYR